MPPGQVGPLTGALRSVVDDRGLRERLGRAARERYEARFTLARMAERTYSLLRGADA